MTLSGGQFLQALFYRNPTPLNPDQHGAMGLNRALDFRFAAHVNAIPLGVAEIPLAALWYPVVFAGKDRPTPVAVVGVREGENLCVDANGSWLAGAYIPAIVRRYPFILADTGENLTLYIDDNPHVLVEQGGAPLFDGEQATSLVEGAMGFCRNVLAGDQATRPFVQALQRMELIEERVVTAQTAAGETVQLKGFSTIDEEGFRTVSDGAFLDLRQRGWLPAIYAQMQSVLNWPRIGELATGRSAHRA
jgi:hypothetical protein